MRVYIYVCVRTCTRNLQSLEILLVVPWKMYDALLLKASKRKFQCLDISPCSALRIHPRPSSFRNTVTFSKPHPARKVGINVNRMSVRSSRKAALLMAYQRHSAFRFGLYAIFALSKNFPLLMYICRFYLFYLFLKYWNVYKGNSEGLILKYV